MKTKKVDVWICADGLEAINFVSNKKPDISFSKPFYNYNHMRKGILSIEVPDKEIKLTQSEFEEVISKAYHVTGFGNTIAFESLVNFLKKEFFND